jgi:P27 family predicted phage terminase small subunit
MGRRGPAPRPTALRLLEGNASKRAIREEVQPSLVVPECPAWLDDEGRAEWERVAPELERMGLLTAIDGAALTGYCQAWATMRKAQQALDDHGLTFMTDTGYVQQRPEVSIAMKSWQLLKAFAAEFGLTPSARARIAPPRREEEVDPLDALRSRSSS